MSRWKRLSGQEACGEIVVGKNKKTGRMGVTRCPEPAIWEFVYGGYRCQEHREFYEALARVIRK